MWKYLLQLSLGKKLAILTFIALPIMALLTVSFLVHQNYSHRPLFHNKFDATDFEPIPHWMFNSGGDMRGNVLFLDQKYNILVFIHGLNLGQFQNRRDFKASTTEATFTLPSGRVISVTPADADNLIIVKADGSSERYKLSPGKASQLDEEFNDASKNAYDFIMDKVKSGGL